MSHASRFVVASIFCLVPGFSPAQTADRLVLGGYSSHPGGTGTEGLYYVVFIAPPGNAERAMVTGLGGTIVHAYTIIPALAVRVPEQQALDAIGADPRVSYVERVQEYRALGTDADPECADASGDQSLAGDATQDILRSWIEQPDEGHLRFSIRVRSLATVNPATGDGLPLNGVWRLSFSLLQAGRSAPDVYFVSLRRPEQGPPEFTWGYVDATGVSTTIGPVQSGQITTATGVISFLVSSGTFTGGPNLNGNPVPGDVLTGPFSQTLRLVGALGTGVLASIDRAPNSGGGRNFTLRTILPPLGISPPALDFGLLEIGANSTQTLTAVNNTPSTIAISSAVSNHPEFFVLPAGGTLAPSGTMTFTVTFAPAGAGSKNGSIVLTHSAAGSPVSIPVSGAVSVPSASESIPWGVDSVRAPQAWPVTKGRPIRIGILDTGIDSLHYDLDGRYKGGYNFVADNPHPWDGHSHGTHVAGTIAAELNGAGVAGVAPEADIYALKVLSDAGTGTGADILAAVDWCVRNGMDIASMSLGGGLQVVAPTGNAVRVPVYSPTEELAYKNAFDAGLLIIVASGNDGEPLVMYPAGYQGAMAVGAVDRQLVRASFSNYGTDLEIVAPGVDIKSTVPRGRGRDSRVGRESDSYEANELEFSAVTAAGGITRPAVNCGKGLFASDFPSAVAGNIALIQRGDSSFSSKVQKAQDAGAIAAIIYNNVTGNFNGTLGTPRDDLRGREWIPGVSLSMEDGSAIAALGSPVVTLVNAVDDFNRFSGTSMATPHVSAVAALAWSVNPSLTNAQVREILKHSARDLGSPGADPEYGAGLADAEAAVAEAAATSPAAREGVLSPEHPAASWSSGPFTGVSQDPTAADCNNSLCDHFTLTVSGTNAPSQDVTIRLEWGSPNNDFDLHVYDAAGSEVATSGRAASTYEQASFAAIEGVYDVSVTVYAAANESYRGSATLVDIPDPPTTFRGARYSSFDFGFTPEVVLPEQQRSLLFVNQDVEPEIEVDRFGTVYIGAIRGVGGGVDFWRSDDGGANFLYLGEPDGTQNPNPAGEDNDGGAGGGDVDMALGDPFTVVPATPLSAALQSPGRLYVTSLWLGSSTLSVSTDRGDNWVPNPFTTAQHDRQWNVARGEKTLYMSLRKLAQLAGTQQHSVYVVQSDDGMAFTKGSFVEDPVTGVQENVAGNIVLTSDGTLIGIYTSIDGRDLYVYRNPKQGVSGPAELPPGPTDVPVFTPDVFETGRVFHSPPGVRTNAKFPLLAIDRGDNLHVVFSNRRNIYLISCPAGANPTHASSWTRPVVLNPPGVAGFELTRTAIFPWIRGGDPGKVACLWYGTEVEGDPDTPVFETAQVPWRIIYAQVENALSDTPDVYIDIASSQGGGVIHRGQICNRGTGCPDGTRELAEYSSLTIDNAGFANIAYSGTVIGGTDPEGTDAITSFTKSTRRPLVTLPMTTELLGCADTAINRTGGWHTVEDPRATDGEYCRVVGGGGASLGFTFHGTRVDLQIARGPRGGNGAVWIDGVSRGQVEFYRAPSDPRKPDNSGKKDLTFGEFVSFETSPGDHTFRIDVTNDNPDGKRDMIYVDGLVITDGGASGNATMTEEVSVTDGVVPPLSAGAITALVTASTSLLTGVLEVPETAAVDLLALDPLGALTAQSSGSLSTRSVGLVPAAAGNFLFRIVNAGTSPLPYRFYSIASSGNAPRAAHRMAPPGIFEVPDAYALGQNYPNPFNPRTTITYELPEDARTRLDVYSVYGQLVTRLVDRTQSAGRYTVPFEAADLPSGVYFYRLTAGRFTEVRRMLLMK